MQCIQIKDYGDLSYLLEAEYERQLVALSQDAELRSPPMGTRGLTKGKVSLFLCGGGGGGGGRGYKGDVRPPSTACTALQLPA